MRKVSEVRLDEDNFVYTVCDDSGIKIYNLDPLAEIGRLETGSTVSACNVSRSNILSFISGGERPKFSQNTLVIYDAEKDSLVMDFTFGEPVLKTLLTKDTAIALLKTMCYAYSVPDGRLLVEAPTRKNSFKPIHFRSNRLAIGGHKQGSVHIYDIGTMRERKSSSPPVQIYAHQGEIAIVRLNSSGSKLATASDKGTLIRVWDTSTKQRLIEFRRGADPAQIYSIAFSKDSAFLAATGDKGTLHLFALKDKVLNKTSAFARAGRVAMIPTQYTDSLWALATGPIPEETESHVCFMSQNRIAVVAVDGTVHLFQFSTDGALNRVEVRNANELDIHDDNW